MCRPVFEKSLRHSNFESAGAAKVFAAAFRPLLAFGTDALPARMDMPRHKKIFATVIFEKYGCNCNSLFASAWLSKIVIGDRRQGQTAT